MKLQAYDMAICRALAYKVSTQTTDADFEKIPFAFPSDPPLPSLDGIRSRTAALAGVQPEYFDCCVNSCCAFTGDHLNLQSCPFCQEQRFADSKPRKRFTYIPLIPRLQVFARNESVAKQMQYRGQYESHEAEPGKMKDIFDSTTYRTLQQRHIHVGDLISNVKYFADRRDVALGLSSDGVSPHKRRKTTCWPLILFDYNLPPDIRFHLEHILSVGVVPGPKKPLDIDSFLWPLIQELLRLAEGVQALQAYDILADELFSLRAFLIVVFGDIPAVSMLMKMKGHNGISPCRMCSIHGLRVPNQPRNTAHYVPHERSLHPTVYGKPGVPSSYDVRNLPLRSHAQFMLQAAEVETTPVRARAEEVAKGYGIKGLPILAKLDSLIFPTSFPYDFMHLIW